MNIEKLIRDATDDAGRPCRQLFISIHCDSCPSIHTYRGEAREATAQLRQNHWTVGRTGIVRCQHCSQAYAVAVHRSIR